MDPILTVALASLVTAIAGWIQGRSTGRKQGAAASLRPPPKKRCKLCEADAKYCEQHSHSKWSEHDD